MLSNVWTVLVASSIEKPTLIERFVSLIPLPYPMAALIWSLVIPSSISGYVIQYLTTGASPLSLTSLPNALLNILLPFYLFVMVRYMRLRVVAAETPIAARLSRGDQDYHRAFGRLTQTNPVLLLTAALGTFLMAVYASTGILSPALLPTILTTIVVYLNALAFSTYLWEFAAVSLGLHNLGGSSLRLGSFLEDRMMGAKPMGNLALSLTITYYGGLLLTNLLLSTFVPSSPPAAALFVALLVLGVALFFLPLNSIHAKMQAEKRRLIRQIGTRYPRVDKDSSQPKENATLEDVHAGLARLTNLQEVEMLDRKIASLPTWPFDIQVVSKFVTIVLSVTAVLLSRVITGFLHI
jgi:hypothetical protein